MEAVRTKNVELFRSILLKDKLWDAISEDGSIGKDEYWPDPDDVIMIALLGKEKVLHGFVVGRPITDTVVETHVAIDPDYWGHKDNVKLGQLGCEVLRQVTGATKHVASIPVTDLEVLRYAQRVGFKREGVNRSSFLRGGELLDQYYVGMAKHDE